MTSPLSVSRWRYRSAVVSRTVAATVGGYVMASASAIVVSTTLVRCGAASLDAVITANALAFVAHTLAALWVFACANATRAWRGIVVISLVLAFVGGWLQRGLS